ncbi:hypothetical protein RCS94_02570 [Orbaceae bacterium ac157xtp]
MLIVLTSYGALSATSANTIKGNAPTIGNDSLGFKVDGEKYSQKLGNIDSAVAKSFNASLTLNDFEVTGLTVDDYADVDGDVADPTTPFTMGTMTAKWYENGSSTPISDMSKTLGCGSNLSLPLKLRIEIPNVQAHSKYGDPRESGATTLTKEYKIGSLAGFCFAKPSSSMHWINYYGTSPDPVRGGGYSSDFDPVNGFKASANPKFPTTGFKGARFEFIMVGNASDYTFYSNSAAVSVNNGYVGFISKPTAPVTITAVLKADTTQMYRYTFDPRSVWVKPVAGSNGIQGWYSTVKTICGGDSKVPSRAELTNSPQKDATISWVRDANYYTRAIGGGLFGEWGQINHDTYGGDWRYGHDYYWTRDARGSGQFLVHSEIGSVDYATPNLPYVACLL